MTGEGRDGAVTMRTAVATRTAFVTRSARPRRTQARTQATTHALLRKDIRLASMLLSAQLSVHHRCFALAPTHVRTYAFCTYACAWAQGQNKKGRSERTQTQKRLKKEERTHKTGRQGDRETGRQEDSRRDRQSTATHKARRRRKRKKKEAWSLTGTQQICWLRRTLSGCRIVSMCCDISSSANTPCVFQEGDEGVRVCGWGEGE